jgi:epsin
LQLLEYLIKHGSERVIDDARAHISTLKMLRNFHYIDEKGKDEGINGVSTFIFVRGTCLTLLLVRNRARELVELLSDVEKIRSERRKAKANRHKYTGTGHDGFAGGSSRYGGFGNDSVSYNNGLLNSW